MKRKIFFATLSSLCAVILFVSGLLTWAVYAASIKRTEETNASEAGMLAAVLDEGLEIAGYGEAARRAGIRITLFSAGGAALYDNMAPSTDMENHRAREEFQEAVQGGTGEAVRRSATLGEQYLYYALQLADGRLLRIARAHRTVLGLMGDLRGTLLGVMLLSLLLAALVARRVADALVRPLASLDLDQPEQNDTYEELTPLLRRIAQQQGQLRAQIDDARLRSRQIAEITKNMREGLIVLDEKGIALSVNESAVRLLDIREEQRAGKHLFALNRHAKLCELFDIVRTGQEAETVMELPERALDLRASPVAGDGGLHGYVLLIVDVTERRNAERMRREFSANVSHELKTPLTSISGYAEIMENGMAKPEDLRAFAGKIRSEARRMISLVEDILRLSKLDEGDVRLPFESVDMRALAEEVVDSLAEGARAKNVRLTVTDGQLTVRAVRQIAWEILTNLIENAIKYNVEGGSVTVRFRGNALIVEDTGIGIAPADRERIFQRFYRVDKSHAKSTGGTGLGLSIVRHGAQYLGAVLSLDSREGVGTRVRVEFPPRR